MAERNSWFSTTLWGRSLAEFRKLNVVVFCGMLCALALVLNQVASVKIGPYIRIGVSMLPNQVVDCLFGPAIGGIFGACLDILKYLMKPEGGFFPGFTLSAFLGGVIYGMFLYRKKVTLPRVFLSTLLVKVSVNLLLNTFWLDLLYGEGFLALLPARIASNAVMLPIDTALTYFVLLAAERTVKPHFADTIRS